MMTGTATPSIWRWGPTPSGGRETSSRSLTVHFPAVAPGTPGWDHRPGCQYRGGDGRALFLVGGQSSQKGLPERLQPGASLGRWQHPIGSRCPPFFGGTAHDVDPGAGVDFCQQITIPANSSVHRLLPMGLAVLLRQRRARLTQRSGHLPAQRELHADPGREQRRQRGRGRGGGLWGHDRGGQLYRQPHDCAVLGRGPSSHEVRGVRPGHDQRVRDQQRHDLRSRQCRRRRGGWGGGILPHARIRRFPANLGNVLVGRHNPHPLHHGRGPDV